MDNSGEDVSVLPSLFPEIFSLNADGTSKTWTIAWTAYDPSLNEKSCLQNVTVIDAIPPTITCPQNALIFTDTTPALTANEIAAGFEVGYTSGRSYATLLFDYNEDGYSTSDNSCNSASGVDPIVACDASLFNRVIHLGIVDSNNPVISVDQTILLRPLVSHLEILNGSYPKLSLDEDGKTAVHVFKYSVSDVSGNEAVCYRTVTVVDDIAPTVTCPLMASVPTDSGVHTSSIYIPRYSYTPQSPHVNHELGHVYVTDNSEGADGRIGIIAVAKYDNVNTDPNCDALAVGVNCTEFHLLPEVTSFAR